MSSEGQILSLSPLVRVLWKGGDRGEGLTGEEGFLCIESILEEVHSESRKT